MSQLNSLLESANPYKSLQSDAARLAAKWSKTGLLEGLASETDKNNMSMILENQAKQLVTEESNTGGGAGYGNFTAGKGAQWAGIALPLVRKVFGQIAAKEFVSVQPMNLPSGLVFFLDFQYGTDKMPFAKDTSLYGNQDPAGTFGNAAAGGLYGAGRFSYSTQDDEVAAIAAANFEEGTADWYSDVNADGAYSASAAAGSMGLVTMKTAALPANWDATAVAAFYLEQAGTIAANGADQLPAFTKVNNSSVGLGDATAGDLAESAAITFVAAATASGISADGGTTSGKNAKFTMTLAGGTALANLTVTCTSGGTGYAAGDTLVFNGATLVAAGLAAAGTTATLTLTLTAGNQSAVEDKIQFVFKNKVFNPGAVADCYIVYAPTDRDRGDFEYDNTNLNPENAAATFVIPEINVQMSSEAIVAKTKKLKAVWTPEFAQDLNAYHSLDAEAELTSIMSEYISLEIDLEILAMLIEDAAAGTEYWSAENNLAINAGGVVNSDLGYYNSQGQWFQTLGTKMQKLSNVIHQRTLRGGANFLVCSPSVGTILESIPGFASNSDGDVSKASYAFGVQKAGQMNSRYTVYKNPYMTENTILMGYRGGQFLEAGAVFAPYIPLIMTPMVYDPNTFVPRKGLLTRYAKKMVRPEFYGKILVSGLNTI
jgi:hypothetical protein